MVNDNWECFIDEDTFSGYSGPYFDGEILGSGIRAITLNWKLFSEMLSEGIESWLADQGAKQNFYDRDIVNELSRLIGSPWED